MNVCYEDHVEEHTDARGVVGIPDLTMYVGTPEHLCFLDYRVGIDAVRYGPLGTGSAAVLDAKVPHESISSAWHDRGKLRPVKNGSEVPECKYHECECYECKA